MSSLTEILYYAWITLITGIYIVPSVVRNVRALWTGDFSLSERSKQRTIISQVRKRLPPLAIVSVGILYFDLEEAYGFKFAAPIQSYVVAIAVGIFALIIGTMSAYATVRILSRYAPALYRREIEQYQSAMTSLGLNDRRVAVAMAVLNGFAEEAIVRVFLMGSLVLFGVPIWLELERKSRGLLI